jgi:hypothetical protein
MISPTASGVPAPAPASEPGLLEGEVQTLSKRGRLRFTLYDSIFDRAVHCYVTPDQEDTMRSAWGRRVVVAGQITRDPATGRPTSIIRIREVDLVEVPPVGSYRRARGAVRSASEEKPEDTIRRMRDA